MATTKTKITKRMLENKLMELIEVDSYIDDNGDEVRISGVDKQAKIAAIKQLCAMRGYNTPTETVVTNKTFTLDF